MKYDLSITKNTSSISGYESTLKSHHIQHVLLVPIKGLKSRSALHSPSTAPLGTSRAARHTAVAQIWWQLSRGVGTRHPNSSPSLAVLERSQRSSLSNKEKQSPHLKVWRSTIGSWAHSGLNDGREKNPVRSVGEAISKIQQVGHFLSHFSSLRCWTHVEWCICSR